MTTKREAKHLIDGVPRGYHVAMAIWTPEDVFQIASDNDVSMSLKDANKILDDLDRDWDANSGITWDTLEWAIQQYVERKRK